MKEIGWVKRPIFGRTSISLPSRTKVFWPISGARHGVAGASRTSTSRKSASASFAKPAAEFLRLRDPGARKHRAGDQPVSNVGIEIARARAQPLEMQRRAFNHRDQIGGRTRLVGPRELDHPVRFQRPRNGIDGGEGAGVGGAGEIAAQSCDPQPRDPVTRALAIRRPQACRLAPGLCRRGRASRHRTAQDR